MSELRTVFLMYHELELPGRPLCQPVAGYIRYVLPVSEFRAQMQWLKQAGWHGMSISDALSFPARGVAITFDDGCETDILAAAPILKECGFGATFYPTVGLLGTEGRLSSAQLRELSQSGFEIGCHSMTHAYLPDLDSASLRREIVDSRLQLEQILGKTVDHFSCPGGRYNEAVVNAVRDAGYRTLATSRLHANSASTNTFHLGRIAITRRGSLQAFEQICRGDLWQRSLSDSLRNAAKQLLGNSLYDRLRNRLMHSA